MAYKKRNWDKKYVMADVDRAFRKNMIGTELTARKLTRLFLLTMKQLIMSTEGTCSIRMQGFGRFEISTKPEIIYTPPPNPLAKWKGAKEPVVVPKHRKVRFFPSGDIKKYLKREVK